MAIKAAEGDGLPQDWAAALDHLQDSAQLGSRLAQAELAALSPAMEAGARHPCGRGGPGLSVAAVPQRHRSRELAAAAEHVEHFGKGPDCCRSGHRHIRNARLADREGSPGLTSAQIYDGKEGRHRSGSGSTNAVCAFPGPDRDLILAIVRARVADVTGLQVRAMETPTSCIILLARSFGLTSIHLRTRTRRVSASARARS